MSSRKAVTLRFNEKDIKLLTLIVQKEFQTTDLKLGLRSMIINTAQAYLNQLSEQMKENRNVERNSGNIDSDSTEERPREGTDSDVLADKDKDMVSSD